MPKDKDKTGEVTKAAETGVTAYDYGQDEGGGMENQTQADVAMPFVDVLQGLSTKQLEAIPNSKVGQLFNTVTLELYPDGIEFIPCMTEHCYVEWIPRKRGGGFVAKHALDSETVLKAKAEQPGELKLKVERKEEDGSTVINDLVETFYVYSLMLEEGQPKLPFVIAHTSTKIKVYKKYNTGWQTIRVPGPGGRKISPPLYAHPTKMTAWMDKNVHGDFGNFAYAPVNGTLKDSLLTPDSPLYKAAKEVYELVKSGQANVNFGSQQDGSGPAEEGGEGPTNAEGEPIF